MRKVNSTTLVLFSLLFTYNSRANHIAGGDLSYVCFGGNQYQINLNLYVDCTTPTSLSTQQTINFSNPCGSGTSTQLDLINMGGTEISQLCPSQINNSTCNGGSLPGMRVFHYSGTITLTPACTIWTISWGTCCRNYAISNLKTTGSAIYLETLLNTDSIACNNSPTFTAQPIPYVCVNQFVNYNCDVIEADGDSLYFSLINAMAAGPTNLVYANGYSSALPIPGITINPKTGQIAFTPTTIGNFVVVVLVQEYDNNGNLIGSVMRDIQFVVQNCQNSIPDPTGDISIIENAVQTALSIEVCEDAAFSIKITYTDKDAGDMLMLSSDISTLLPGATFITTGLNPIVATINWTPPSGSANSTNTFNVRIDDGSCPVPGQQLFTYTIKIVPPCIKDTSMLFIPNVFTPGGLNPVFLVSTKNIRSYSIQIVDRWGKKIFESNDTNNSWDGTNAVNGIYYYLIKAIGTDDKQYDEKGFLHLLR